LRKRSIGAIRGLHNLNRTYLEFQQEEREIDGRRVRDYKLSDLPCYLTAMNGDCQKRRCKAQAYFATVGEVARQYFQTPICRTRRYQGTKYQNTKRVSAA